MNSNIEVLYSIRPFIDCFKSQLKERLGHKKQPLILLQGGFGKHNTGDDTLMLVAYQTIKEVLPQAKIMALCHNPEFLRADYNIEGIKFCSADTFKYLFKCDALVVPAGGLVNNIDYNSYLRSLFNPRGKFVFISMLIAIVRRKYTVIFGVGIHDVPDFVVKVLTEITLPRVSLLGVRDRHTVDFVKSIGCKDFFFSHDPAIIYRQRKCEDWNFYKERKGIPFDKFIVINYRATKSLEDSVKALEELVKYIKWVNINYPELGIVFMPFSIHPSFELENDVIAMKKIVEAIKGTVAPDRYVLLKEYQTADDVKTIATHASLLILTRHHAPVITYSCQVPTVVVSYNYKCREFAELGEYKYIIDYADLTSGELERITSVECKTLV